MTSHRLIARLVLAAGLPLSIVGAASGQAWTGGSAVDSNWTTSANWTSLPLNNGSANITFAGGPRTTPVVNVAQDVNSITFITSASGFALLGPQMLTIRSGGVSVQSAVNQILGGPVSIPVSQTWNAVNGDLLVASTSSITLNAGATLTLAQNSALRLVRLSGPSSGVGALVKNGPGRLAVAAALAHTGGVTVTDGTLQLESGGSLPDTGTVGLTGVATFDVGGQTDTIGQLVSNSSTTVVSLPSGSALTVGNGAGAAYTFAGQLTGPSTGTRFTKAGPGTLTLSGASTFAGTVQVTAGTLVISAGQRLSSSCRLSVDGGTFDPQSFTQTVDVCSATAGILGGAVSGLGTITASAFNLDGGIIRCRLEGAATLTKNNAATNLFISAPGSTYTGPTIINGGVLTTNGFNVLPDTTVVTINPPGRLEVINFDDTVAGISGAGAINVISATLAIGAGNVSSTFSGVIGDAGLTGGITKIGNGSLLLTGANTFSGTTTVSAGSLSLGDNERLANSSDVVINSPGRLIVREETIDRLTLNGGELRPAVIGTGFLRANAYDLNAGFVDARLVGPGGIVKAGTGVVTLAAANDPAFTRIDAGVLSLASDSALGAPDTDVLLNGGTLRLTAPVSITRPVLVTAPSTIECLGDVNVSDLTGGFLGSPLTKAGPGRLTISGVVSSIASLSVSAGEVNFAPLSLIQGNTLSTAAAGTLVIDSALANFGSVTNQGDLVLRGAAPRLQASALTNSGVISGSGRLAAPLSNAAAGDIRIGLGDAMHFASTNAHANAGLIEVIGGAVEFDGPLTNSASSGLIFARNGLLRFDGGLTNLGSVALSFGVTDVFGDVDNRPGAAITISGASDATFVDDVLNNGTIRTSTGGNTVFLGAVSGSGSFPGAGLVFLEGDLRPGNSPGLVTFGGDVVLGSFSTLVQEIAGSDPAQFDRTTVAGTAFLDGVLDVRLLDGFTPAGIQSFTVLSAGSVVGRFGEVRLPPGAGLAIRYTATEVRLTTCLADVDGNGVIDPDDLSDFIGAFFATPPAPETDFNNDGFIDPDDLADYIATFFGGC